MNYKVFFGVFAIAFLLFGCVQPPQPPGNATIQASGNPLLSEDNLTASLGEGWEQKYPELAAKIAQQQQNRVSKRGDYLPAIVFADLPAYPKDFDEIQLLVYIGRITDMNKIGPEYYKQPEFYPQFIGQGVPLYQNPPKDRWGAFGYGTYPSEVIVNSPRNAEWNVSFFVHTSWQVQTYQGVGFNVLYPVNASLVLNNFPDGQRLVTQDSEKVRQYFDVTVTPRDLLLEPAFPTFKLGWTELVNVKVKAKDVPPGRYAIGLDIGGPSEEHGQEWLWKYKTQYSGNAGMTGVGRPWYTVFVEVT